MKKLNTMQIWISKNCIYKKTTTKSKPKPTLNGVILINFPLMKPYRIMSHELCISQHLTLTKRANLQCFHTLEKKVVIKYLTTWPFLAINHINDNFATSNFSLHTSIFWKININSFVGLNHRLEATEESKNI